jgi:hypothetical protein
MISRKIMKTISPLGKIAESRHVALPEIPAEWKRNTRPRADKIEAMLLEMGFQPLTPELRAKLVAAGHYGMPQD